MYKKQLLMITHTAIKFIRETGVDCMSHPADWFNTHMRP